MNESRFNLDELGSLLQSISKIDWLEQTKQDELVRELVNRWIFK